MKKLFYCFLIFIFIFLFLPSLSLAIPGQLIYDINVPQQPVNTLCDEVLSTCRKESELQKAQGDKMITLLKNELSQEKKKTLTLELVLAVVVLSFVIVVVFLKKKSTSPIITQNQQQLNEN